MSDLKIMFRWLLVLCFVILTVVFAKVFMVLFWIAIAVGGYYGKKKADEDAKQAKAVANLNKIAHDNLEELLKKENLEADMKIIKD